VALRAYRNADVDAAAELAELREGILLSNSITEQFRQSTAAALTVVRVGDGAAPPPSPHIASNVRRMTWQRKYGLSLVLVDLAVSSCAAVVAYLVRFGSTSGRHFPGEVLFSLAFPVGFVLSIAAARGYEARFLGTGSDEYRKFVDGLLRYGAIVAVCSYAIKLQLSRGDVVIAFALAGVLGLLGRRVGRNLLRRRRRRGSCLHNVIVVGRERSVAELTRQLGGDADCGFNVVGACLDRAAGRWIEDVPVLGTTDEIVSVLRTSNADTLAISPWSDVSQAQLRSIAWELEGSGVSILMAPRLTDIAAPRIHVRPVAGLPMMHVGEPEFSGSRRVLKGALERLIAAATLIVLGPALLLTALAVRLDSPGPALFRQRRVGSYGREFTILKFRTMHVDAEHHLHEISPLNESDGLLFKIRQDPRVTRVGRILRRWSIDEAPQLLNVLFGAMSLVGPRPPLPSEVAKYTPDVARRLLVKPGLTGLWQISGRSDLSWEEAVRLDLYYVENWSPALDLSILWRTTFAVIASRGAY
jgi:exopolysaccharide biosynthesis polyprenyl glycosylphosphotransferase